MRKNKCLIGLFGLLLVSGCMARPVFGPAHFSVGILGRNVVYYDQQDPLIGEVIYQGIEGVTTEAKIFLDGKHIITLEAKGSEVRLQPVGVGNYGWHTIHGEIFEVRGKDVKIRVLCFRHNFFVSIKNRNAAFYWWRVEINPQECY